MRGPKNPFPRERFEAARERMLCAVQQLRYGRIDVSVLVYEIQEYVEARKWL